MRILIKSAFCFVVLSFPIIARGTSSNELTTFVNNAIKQLNESSLKVPGFEKAALDTFKNIGKVNGNDLYLCLLRNEKGSSGYIAVAESSGSFQVVAFSATTASPDYFLKNLTLNKAPEKQLNFSTTEQESFVENVPLVATTKTLVAKESFETSEIGSALSSLFNYFQNKDKIFMFGHLDSDFTLDPEYSRRYKENPSSVNHPNDPNWKSFDDEAREAIERENIPKVRQNEFTSEQRAKIMQQARQITKPIIRRRLLNPVNVGERVEVIRGENNTIRNVTRVDISSGMRDAILIQQDYINENTADMEQDIELFLKTRGRKAKIEKIAFQKYQTDSLPAILIGPDNIAGVLLGFLDIDGESFAYIFFPKTGKPSTMSLTQKDREIRIAKGLPAEFDWENDPEYQEALKIMKEAEEKQRQVYKEKGIPDPIPEKSAEERVRESLLRIRATEDKIIVVEDINSKVPEELEDGIQIINCSSLSSWQVLNISNIQVGDNW